MALLLFAVFGVGCLLTLVWQVGKFLLTPLIERMDARRLAKIEAAQRPAYEEALRRYEEELETWREQYRKRYSS